MKISCLILEVHVPISLLIQNLKNKYFKTLFTSNNELLTINEQLTRQPSFINHNALASHRHTTEASSIPLTGFDLVSHNLPSSIGEETSVCPHFSS